MGNRNKFDNRGGGGQRGGAGGGRGGGQTRGGYKNQANQQQYPQQERQQPGSASTGMPTAPKTAAPLGQQQLTLPATIDAGQLDQLVGEQRNNFVGNTIFGLIQAAFGDDIAPRITGMLLDENAVNYKQLLTDNQYFTNKVNEAYSLLMTVGSQ